MLGWDTKEAENVCWMAQNNYWMIQAKVHMSKYGGQPDTPSYIWVWSTPEEIFIREVIGPQRPVR